MGIEDLNPKIVTPSEAKTIITEDKLAREKRAGDRIKQILVEERCILIPKVILSSGSVVGKIDIEAME